MMYVMNEIVFLWVCVCIIIVIVFCICGTSPNQLSICPFIIMSGLFLKVCQWVIDLLMQFLLLKGILPVKNWALVCWWRHFDCSFAQLIALVISTTCITISWNKNHNGDILVPANWGPFGKWPLQHGEFLLLSVGSDYLWHSRAGHAAMFLPACNMCVYIHCFSLHFQRLW